MTQQLESTFIFTASKRSLGQGNIFAPVCHSVRGGGIPACLAGLKGLGIPACLAGLQAHTWGGSLRGLAGGGSPGPHPGQSLRGLAGGSPGPHSGGGSQHALSRLPPDGYCHGQYTSYWNAFLLPPVNEVWDKVIFLHLFVILFMGGHAWPGGMHGEGGHMWQGHAWQKGGCAWQRGGAW